MLKSVLCQRVKCYKSSLHDVCSNHTNQISYHEGKAELDSPFTTIVSIDRLPREIISAKRRTRRRRFKSCRSTARKR